jgi:hypothetical protein
MKLHTIVFVDNRGYAESRTIHGIGRVSTLSVGQDVGDGANLAVILSLECDTRSGVLVIRKRSKEGGNPAAGREWNNSDQRREADFCVIHMGTATCYGNDADQPQKGVQRSELVYRGSEVVQAPADPPPAKPIPATPKGGK